jgi:hypothetical protein
MAIDGEALANYIRNQAPHATDITSALDISQAERPSFVGR